MSEKVKQKIREGDTDNISKIINGVAEDLNTRLEEIAHKKSNLNENKNKDICQLVDKKAKAVVKDKIENSEKPRSIVKKAIKEIPEIRKWVMEKNSKEWMQIFDGR